MLQYREEITDGVIREVITDVAPELDHPDDPAAAAEAARVAAMIRPYCLAAAIAAAAEGEPEDYVELLAELAARVIGDPLARAAWRVYVGRLRLCLD